MVLFPPIPYTPAVFHNQAEQLVVYYLWDPAARDELRNALQERQEDFAAWYATMDKALQRLLVRVERRRDGALVETLHAPSTFDERLQWYQHQWPPRVLGELCGAIVGGVYDGAALGKS